MNTAYVYSINDVNRAAEMKVGIEGWLAYRWQATEGGSIVTGCVPCGTHTKGKNKGTPRFTKPIQGTQKIVVVTDEEMATLAEQFEAKTGRCWNCKGEGTLIAGWSKEGGTLRKPCKRCQGKGVCI